MRYADVAVDAPVGYGRTFSYSVPDSLSLSPGHVVRVPFGPRTAQGVVISLAPVAQVADTREIIGTTLPDAILEAHQLDLARWISDYYLCSLFEAAALMLPPGERVRARTYISVDLGPDAGEELSLTPFQRKVLDYIRRRGAVEQGRLIRAFGETARGVLGRLAERGIIVRSEGRGRPALGPKYVSYAEVTSEGREALKHGVQAGARRAPRQAALLDRLSTDASPLTLADARREYGSSAVAALLAKAWIAQTKVVVERDPLRGKAFPPSPPVTLTPRQSAAASKIRAALDDRAPGGARFLVQGVTGSGKTEVYLDAVAHCMKLGKRATVLVPEIALTHQTVEAFASRFPGQIAVLHSGLSAGERYDQWWKIKRGEYAVVIGSRSAVFAPQPDLGLIVIDEEHEWTYKQADSSPRYHAREVAERLASVIPAVVVLGSASPDLASYSRANRGEMRLLTLPDRVRVDGGRPTESTQLAAVEVVDMRRELREGNREIFSRVLQSDMKECLDAGRQMVLFLNRRGSASHMQCRNCGLSLRCRRCEIALAYHRELDRLLCHYCGYKRIAPAKCSRCLSYRLGYYGVGTETVVEEMAQLFPGVETIRWDRDAARSQKAYESLFKRFKSGKARVLVGTQMIAKGLHFPSVSLVGVVSADIGLNLPDYRASERVFQLLCQVAGRSGRGTWPGKVVIQTYQPDSYAIRAAASQDYPRFYAEEIAFRGEQSNPPFGRLIRLLFSHTNRALCEQEAQRMSREMRDERESWALSDVEVLGSTPAYPARLRGHYRWQLVLRGPDPRALLDKVAMPPGWVVDIDPVSLA